MNPNGDDRGEKRTDNNKSTHSRSFFFYSNKNTSKKNKVIEKNI
jgi:hypothetical protein